MLNNYLNGMDQLASSLNDRATPEFIYIIWLPLLYNTCSNVAYTPFHGVLPGLNLCTNYRPVVKLSCGGQIFTKWTFFPGADPGYFESLSDSDFVDHTVHTTYILIVLRLTCIPMGSTCRSCILPPCPHVFQCTGILTYLLYPIESN
jgi:hypothetical protein